MLETMKKRCNVCDSIDLEYSKSIIQYNNGAVDDEEEIRCKTCGNLVWGKIKRRSKMLMPFRREL